MKNPFKKWNKKRQAEETIPPVTEEPKSEQIAEESAPLPADKSGDDGFTEWARTQTRGGIERRERNDIFEAYSVFGTDTEGNLLVRLYHRYPEHEKEFSLSYSRKLSFEEFNRRLLTELDRGDLKFSKYLSCIEKAHPDKNSEAAGELSESDEAILRDFCEAADILQNKTYLHSGSVFRCECESAVGAERLNLWFRRPLPYDALDEEIGGVKKDLIDGFDIDNLWIMGIFNRLRERCGKIQVWRLTSEWTIEQESLCLFAAQEFPGLGGILLIAVGEADSFKHFGFYSLDFSKK
ncbi:MAG: hypothetical protein IJH32_09895 [Ruminococcus sp.]|nr:hypothetical protein [Ruminococcus sp.]